jgi:hypothetical protein
MGLGVCVNEQNLLAHQSESGRDIESRGGLPYSSFLIGNGDNQKLPPSKAGRFLENSIIKEKEKSKKMIKSRKLEGNCEMSACRHLIK